jgi:alkyldihydroxyacetonephosphate synthase
MSDLPYWGWGGVPPSESIQKRHTATALNLCSLFNMTPSPVSPSVDVPHVDGPRFVLPPDLYKISSHDNMDRLAHVYGKSFRDLCRGFNRDYPNVPDYIVYPREEGDIVDLLQFCSKNLSF